MKRDKYIFLIVCSIVLPFIVVGLSLVLKSYIDDERTALDASYTTLHVAEARERYLKDLEKSVKDSSDMRSQLTTHFIDAKTTAGFLGDLETMGRSLSLETKTVSLGIENGTLGVGISLAGHFASIHRFFELVEQLPYNVELQNVTLKSVSAGVWSGDAVLRVISFEQ